MFANFTREKLDRVMSLLEPMILEILKDDTLAPKHKFVMIRVFVKGDQDVFYAAELSLEGSSRTSSEEKLIDDIATNKAQVSLRTGMPTSLVYSHHSDLYESGDYLYAGGVVDPKGNFAVGTSGISEFADERISQMVLDWMNTLSRLETSTMRSNGIGQMPLGEEYR